MKLKKTNHIIISLCTIVTILLVVAGSSVITYAVADNGYEQNKNVNVYGFNVENCSENRMLYNIGGMCDDNVFFSQNNIDLTPISEPLQTLMNKIDVYKQSTTNVVTGNVTLYSLKMKFGESIFDMVVYPHYSNDCNIVFCYSEKEDIPANQQVIYCLKDVSYDSNAGQIVEYFDTFIDGVNIFGYELSEASKIDVYYDNGITENTEHQASAVFDADLSPVANEMNSLMNEVDGLQWIYDNAGYAADTEKYTIKMQFGESRFTLVIYNTPNLKSYTTPLPDGCRYFYFEQVNDAYSVKAYRKYYEFTSYEYSQTLDVLIQYLDTLVAQE
ncbi:MAG: hypothetical protein PHE93_01510 [Clostridia bacterium]|nr:hypothetical protein [Clostridia bacterium]